MGNIDSVRLLEAQATEQITPEFLRKMMAAAVQKGDSATVESLFRRGANANDPLASGATPLDAAASAGDLKVVRALLDHGADPNRASQSGTSPLENASLRGFDAIAEMLLDHGALVNEVNSGSGTTALYAAASFGKGDVVGLLYNGELMSIYAARVAKLRTQPLLKTDTWRSPRRFTAAADQKIVNRSRVPS